MALVLCCILIRPYYRKAQTDSKRYVEARDNEVHGNAAVGGGGGGANFIARAGGAGGVVGASWMSAAGIGGPGSGPGGGVTPAVAIVPTHTAGASINRNIAAASPTKKPKTPKKKSQKRKSGELGDDELQTDELSKIRRPLTSYLAFVRDTRLVVVVHEH